MRIFVALALCLGFQFSAFAKTEHFYTADKGQFFVEGSANYLNSGETSTDPSSGGTSLAEYTLEDLKFTAHAEYGFLDFLSVYANLAAGYGENVEDGQDTVEARFKALDNLNLGAKSTYQFGPGAALAALNVGLGIGKKSKKNRTFGNAAFDLKLGYELGVSKTFNLGILLHHGLYSTDAQFTQTADVGLEGATIISLFGEHKIGSASYLGWDLRYGQDVLSIGLFNSIGSAGLFIPENREDSSRDAYGLKLHYKQNFSEALSLIASLAYDTYSSEIVYEDWDEATDTDNVTANIKFRVAF